MPLTLAVINPIAMRLGPLTVRWYGIIVVGSIVAAVWVAQRAARRTGLEPQFLERLATWAVPIGFLGARAYEVFILQWPYYQTHPWDIPAIWKGGLAIHGGLLAGALAGIVYVLRHRQNPWLWGDAVAPAIALAQAIGRWGNFFNQEAYGVPATQAAMRWWPGFIREQMFIDGAYRHPTFLYESLWNLAAFVILYGLQRRRLPAGAVACLYLILYNTGRFLIEGIREDSTFIFGEWRVAQLMAVALILAGAAGLAWRLGRDGFGPELTSPDRRQSG